MLRFIALGAAVGMPATALAASYTSFQKAAASYVRAEKLLLNAHAAGDREPYDVIHCLAAPAAVGDQPGVTSLMAVLAIEAAVTRADLQTLGYPKAVIEDEVSRWESATLAIIMRNEDADIYSRSATLARGLETWRKSHAPRLRPLVAEGGCGAGEGPVRFDLRPKGRLALIPRFYFAACQADGIDPYDRRRCQGWGEVAMDRDIYLSGNYAYAASWADGRSRRGDLRIDPGDDEEAGPPIIVTPER